VLKTNFSCLDIRVLDHGTTVLGGDLIVVLVSFVGWRDVVFIPTLLGVASFPAVPCCFPLNYWTKGKEKGGEEKTKREKMKKGEEIKLNPQPGFFVSFTRGWLEAGR